MDQEKFFKDCEIARRETGRMMVVAAHKVLQSMVGEKVRCPNDPRCVLDALEAARKVKDSNRSTFAKWNAEQCFASHDLQEHHAVATALCFIDDDLPEDVAIYSVGGARLLAFASTLIAINAYREMQSTFDDPDLLGHFADGLSHVRQEAARYMK